MIDIYFKHSRQITITSLSFNKALEYPFEYIPERITHSLVLYKTCF